MNDDSLTGELPVRRHRLLLAAVQEFIATAEPVGSQQLATRRTLGVRAAMVRNLMAELEEAGYLHQPHTSAGRIPTDKGYRYYVDHLVGPGIAFEDRAQIELYYSGSQAGDVNEIVRESSRLLALMSGQASLVMGPRLDGMRLERVTFVRLRECEVLAIFVTIEGTVYNRVVRIDHDRSQDELERMAAYLNDALAGRTLEQAHRWIEERLKQDRAIYDGFMRTTLMLGGVIARNASPVALYVDGSTNALEQPEFSDRARLKELLRALEDKTALLELLERNLAHNEPMVSIGSENFDARLSGLSVVAASYVSGTMPLGSLAVVGPVRMNYERVIPLVGYTARALSRALEH
ncbi:MAG: heat-inducible transcriptional repressor HrcA [Candidatus Binataceae bacterium]